LVSPTKFFWYSTVEGDAGVRRMERDLSGAGLPWLEQHVELPSLVRALEADRDRRAAERGIWPFRRSPLKEKGPKPIALRVLSYCYEEQGRLNDAVQAWRQYLGTLALGPGPEDIERLHQLEAKGRVGT
jgi:hypothetical protein